MNAILDFFNAPWLQALGYTLLHSLWEASLVGATVIIVLRFLPEKFSNVRYAVASVGLLAILSTSIGTFIYLYSNTGDYTFTINSIIQMDSPVNASASSDLADIIVYFAQVKHFIQSSLPLFLIVWVAGTFLFSLRLLTGLLYVERLKSDSAVLRNEWVQHIQLLAQGLNIKRLITLAESSAIQAPVVVGYFKPFILIPIGMCTSLSTAQLETIFLHEIMHIRRKDYLINLVQVAVESVYFFNPFVWIISGIMKREREHCCDDAVVQLHGNATEYAHALATLEELRLAKTAMALSLADNKNELLNRIKRLMEKSVKNYSGRERIVPALLLVIGLICASWISTQTGRKETSDQTNVVAADTNKKEKKNRDKKAEASAQENAVEAEDRNPKTEAEEDDALSYYHVPPIPDFKLAIPPIPELDAMPPLPAHELTLMLKDMEALDFPSENANDWEAFSKEFEESFKTKFESFYKRHGEDIQKMMEDAQTKINGQVGKEWEVRIQEFASQQEAWAKNLGEDWEHQTALFAEQQENFRSSSENMAAQHEEFEKSVRDFERNMKAFEEDMRIFEKQIRSELIKDGYLDKDEKLETMRWENDSLEINGKKIKSSDQEKYNDLHKKYFPKCVKKKFE